MKKIMVLIAAVLCVISLLVGCGSKPELFRDCNQRRDQGGGQGLYDSGRKKRMRGESTCKAIWKHVLSIQP